MNKETIIPFFWKGWDQQDTMMITYYDVKFYEDFGNIKKGTEYKSIDVDYGLGVINIWSEVDMGTCEIVQHFKCIPL